MTLEANQNAENLARLFHDTYERLAVEYGYETRLDSRVPWDEVPEKNRRLMVAVAAAVLAHIDGQVCDTGGET